MAKPATKNELIAQANEQFDKLWATVDLLSEAEQSADFCINAQALTQKDGAAHWQRDKNLRDVLAHLHQWHQLLIDWEGANSSGINKPFLPSPYTWKTYGQMNEEFWQMHQSTPLKKAKELLKSSHNSAMEIIKKYTDQQLFTKKYFSWTGTSSLGQYCISATASHYDWAIKKLRVQIKALRES